MDIDYYSKLLSQINLMYTEIYDPEKNGFGEQRTLLET